MIFEISLLFKTKEKSYENQNLQLPQEPLTQYAQNPVFNFKNIFRKTNKLIQVSSIL